MKTKKRLTYDQKRDRKTRGTETLGQYIPVYRWLISFIKIAKELEKKLAKSSMECIDFSILV